MKDKVNISPLKPQWIEDIAKIHFNSLPNDFLPNLGLDFLIHTFYPSVFSSSFGKVFIALNEVDEPVGFVLVTVDSSEFFKEIIKSRFLEFIKIGVISSLKSLTNLKNNCQIILSSIFSNHMPNSGEIYVIAVKKSFRGKGIGKQLVERSIGSLEEDNLSGIRIKTLASNTEWIGYFYEEGWELEKIFQLVGKEYVSLVYTFENKSSAI